MKLIVKTTQLMLLAILLLMVILFIRYHLESYYGASNGSGELGGMVMLIVTITPFILWSISRGINKPEKGYSDGINITLFIITVLSAAVILNELVKNLYLG